MSDSHKTKDQLIGELNALRQRVADLEGESKLHSIEAQLARRNREFTELCATLQDITADLGSHHVQQTILRRAAGLVNAAMGRIFLVRLDTNQLQLSGTWPDGLHLDPEFGQPLAEQIIKTGESLTLAGQELQLAQPFAGLSRFLGVPIKRGELIVGALQLFDEGKFPFSLDDARLLKMFAVQAAIALENTQLYEIMEAQVEELATLNYVSQAINSTLDLSRVLTLITDHLILQLDAAAASIALRDQQDEDYLTFVAASGGGAPFMLGQRLKLGRGVMGWVAQQAEPVLVPDVSTDTRFFKEFDRQQGDFVTHSILAVPLQSQHQTIGVLAVFNKRRDTFGADDLKTLTSLAAPAATAIQNARLYIDIRHELNERRQAEEELKASEKRFRQVITSISDHIYASEISENGERINYYHSPNIEILTGYPPEKFSENWYFWPSTLIYPDDKPKAAAQAARLSTGQASEVEYRLVRADGKVIWVRDSARVEMNDQTQIIYGVVADITERKQRERELEIIVAVADALRVASNRLEMVTLVLDQLLNLLEMAASALVVADRDRAETVIEQGRGVWLEATGHRFSMGEGATPFSQNRLYVNNNLLKDDPVNWPASLDKLPAVAGVSLQVQNDFIGSLVVGRHDEIAPELLPLLITIGNMAANALHRLSLFEALQQSNQELARERALLAERVEERTTELRIANAELARAARLKDEFLANMSHELRTPLHAILGMSEVLRSQVYGPLNQEQFNALQHIDEGGRHLLNLINDILDVSKIEAGQLELLLNAVPVSTLCEASLQFIRQIAQAKQLAVDCQLDERLDTILVDERRLKQILVNLLSNAAKFTPKGGQIGLTVTADAEQRAINFIVWDTGIGIASEDMSQIFEPFIQIDSGLARQQEGTGLGLSLVYRLARMHGGSVSVESELGQGSRFTISVPWLTPDGVPLSLESSPSPVSGLTNSTDRHRAAVIMLVKDAEINVAGLEDLLRRHDYALVIANDEQSVKLARESLPDLMVIDVHMRGLDNFETIRQIRRINPKLARIPIIALTALTTPGDRRRCLEAGASDYLRKPVDPAKLLEIIEFRLGLTDNKVQYEL